MTTSFNTSDIGHSIAGLEEDGSNWYTFQERFSAAADYKGVWGHFDGSAKRPVNPTTPAEAVEEVPSPKPGDKEVSGDSSMSEGKGKAKADPGASSSELKKWDDREKLARYFLLTKIPDSVMAKYSHKKLVAKMWRAIVKEFTNKSAMMQSNMYSEFMAMWYTGGKNGDLRKELDAVRMKRKMLINVGVTVSEADYSTLAINFLPDDLATFVAGMSASFKAWDESDDDSDSEDEEILRPRKIKKKRVLKAESIMQIATEE